MSILGVDRESFNSVSSFYSTDEIEEPEVLFPLATIRNLHEKDTICTVCNCNFGVKGLAHTQKAQCKFCYRGVCVRCLVFYYYHSESKVYEKMCPNCHNRLVAISEEFAEQIRQARLERIQLRKEIELSSKEKEMHIEERKIIETELASAKEDLIMSSTEKEKILDQADKKNKELRNKLNEIQNINSELNKNLVIPLTKYNDLKAAFDELKQKSDHELQLINSLKDEISQIQVQKISLMKTKESESTNNSTDEKVEEIESLKDEISDLKEKIIEKTQELKDLNEILIECENEKNKRNSKINECKKSLYDCKNSIVENEISAEDQKKLENMKDQIEKYDELIETLNQRLLNKSVKSMKKSSFYVNSNELPINQIISRNSLKENDRVCVSKCHNCVIS